MIYNNEYYKYNKNNEEYDGDDFFYMNRLPFPYLGLGIQYPQLHNFYSHIPVFIPMFPCYSNNKKNCPYQYYPIQTRYEDSMNLNLAALDAYVYGYPLVLMMVTRANMLNNGYKVNKFVHQLTLPNYNTKTVLDPNSDMLYSMSWLDLSKGPIILVVPDTIGHYNIFQVIDPWTNVFSSLGTRTTGTRPNRFIIYGPNYNGKLPEDYIPVEAPNNSVWLVGQTKVNGSEDYKTVNVIQEKYILKPMDETIDYTFSTTYDNTDIFNNLVSGTKSPHEIVNDMDAKTYFETMAKAMYLYPPEEKDPDMDKKLEMLGIMPSLDFDYNSLSDESKEALQYAINNGPMAIDEDIATISNENMVNGWSIIRENIGIYGKDYRRRAAIAKIKLAANLPEDEVFAISYLDNNKNKLSGKKNYIIHFNKNDLPPVNAFWSISMYNKDGRFIANPINRYAISPHLGKLNYNSDGSLDIYVQNTSPGQLKQSNWLPSPTEDFYLVLRLYWPKQTVLKYIWNPPSIMEVK
ncbi:MAG: DUF1254 domain-containing protein [Clostridia bacterium]|nr:DUF1254 domain-containing protein [Clostridia bacterium]